MLKPEDINWGEAPEGTQAAILAEEGHALRTFGRWRKFEDGRVFYFKDGEWKRNTIATIHGWKEANAHVLKPEVKEAHLPRGLKWKEGYAYYNPEHGGFFFNLEKYYHAGWEHVWTPGSVDFWLKCPNTIHKYGKAKQPEVKKEQPKPKVGWW